MNVSAPGTPETTFLLTGPHGEQKELPVKEIKKCLAKSGVIKKYNQINLALREGIWVDEKTVRDTLSNMTFEQLEKIEKQYHENQNSRPKSKSLKKAHSYTVERDKSDKVRKPDHFSALIGGVKFDAETCVEEAAKDFIIKHFQELKHSGIFEEFSKTTGNTAPIIGLSSCIKGWMKDGSLSLKSEDRNGLAPVIKKLIIEKILTSLTPENPPFVKITCTTPFNPPEDIHQQEIFDTPDGDGALGRVETTSKTDKHQEEGPRNDDNVSFTLFTDGSSVLVETDGAGSGGKGSWVLSHELNKNVNQGLTQHAAKLNFLAKIASKTTEHNTKEELMAMLGNTVRSIVTESLKEAMIILKSSPWVSEKEKLSAGTTLSVMMSVKLSDEKTMTFGLQNHDSASLLWNPQTGHFDATSLGTESLKTQIAGDEKPEKSIALSKFFTNEFAGKRLAMAFSDGVIDNLPGITDQQKLDILNEVIQNPIFDFPIDIGIHEPDILLTKDKIRKIGRKTIIEEITPKKIRDRILNFCMWASAGQRIRQENTDTFEKIHIESARDQGPLVENIPFRFQNGQEIEENLFEALPSNAQNKVVKQQNGKYLFHTDDTLYAHAISATEFEKLGKLFKEKVPQIRCPLQEASPFIQESLKLTYEKRAIPFPTDIVVFFDRKIDEEIGNDYVRRSLEEVQKGDKGAISGKTDGVSVVVTTIG